MKPLRAAFIPAFCLFLRSSAAWGDGPGLAEIVERFDHLRVGDAVAVSGLLLSAGHFDCTLKSGRAAPVRAGDEIVGLFFEGEGAMEYVSVDPVEAPVVLFNAKKASGLKAEKTDRGIALRDSFKHLLWLARGKPVPELSGAVAPPLADAFRKEREKFGRIHAPPISQSFALREIDAPAAPFVWAEMEGGEEDAVYELDGMDNPSEELAVLHRSESSDPEMRRFLWPVTLSHQPIGRDRRDPPRPRFLLTDVDFELVASAGNDAKLTVVETLVPMEQTLSALRLGLDSIVYAQVGANLGTRSEKLRSVTDEKGRPLAFDHRLNQAVIQLAEPAGAGKPVKIRFEIEGDFLVRPGGDNYWELGVGNWFPQPYLSGQYYTLHALVRVKKPFVPFAPGTTIRRVAEGDENVLETRIDKPVQYAVVLAGKYEVHEEVRRDVTIRVATYALNNPRAMKQLTDLAETIIGYYDQFLGPFPFREYNIIEINDYGYGQAPPGVMFITKEAFNPLLGEMNQLFSQGVNETFAHEIAHQYWGIVVKMPSYEEQWLTESFAEYCAALFLRTHRHESVYNTLRKHWRRRADFATEAAPIPLANRVWVSHDAITRSQIRNGLLYDKGPLLLEALNHELGDETFLTFLKSIQKTFAWKFGSTRQIAGLLQFMTKKDFSPFFDQYFWGTAMPKD